jgi:hypothetical protein
MKNSQAVQAAGAAAAAAAIAEKNAAAAAAAAAAVGRDYLKQVRFYLSKITGVFAQVRELQGEPSFFRIPQPT